MCLFTTLVRFDPVYYSHFKCNLRRLIDYPRLWRYTKKIYALPGVARTVDLREIKEHYYRSIDFRRYSSPWPLPSPRAGPAPAAIPTPA